MYLVIVESPAKGKTIQQFLKSEYKVLSSYGHIRDLPKGELGIDVDNNFQPKYVIPTKARKNVNILKKEAKKAKLLILATDEDREGEAIAWHINQILNSENTKPYQRIVFHEITKKAIEQALKNPRKININMVNAQKARRTLDRLVGYKLSPFLWKKVVKRLSAGRVQSIATRLVCEKEEDIKKFKSQEYWSIEALLKKLRIKDQKLTSEFKALLIKKDEKLISKFGIKDKKYTDKIIKRLNVAEYEISNIKKKEIKRNSLPPFTTSSLQQESWKKFHWPAKFTMRIAQQLYETGLISYHRTDSLNLSEISLFSAKKFIINNYGKNYWAGFFKKYKTKSKNAQEAHEAIRPTNIDKTPKKLEQKTNINNEQFRLYNLIWRRFIASQMNQAIFDSTIIDIIAKPKNILLKLNKKSVEKENYTFRANGQILKFDGFLKIYPIKFEETELPLIKNKETLELTKLIPLQHFTKPPARYTEATLIKVMEENEIGRPSTYASILSTIQERNYIEKNEEKRFQPTEIGVVVNNLLVKHFPKIVDIKFTIEMEENLDKIAEGKEKLTPIIKDFYIPFEKNLEKKYKEISKQDIAEEKTEKKCPECKAFLIIKLGRFGKFYACPNFPKCKYTEAIKKQGLGIKCPKCKKGEITQKRTKKKKIFYGCSNWPNCNFALWDKPINEKCQKCDSLLTETKKGQIKCSNKDCDFEKNIHNQNN